VLLLEVDGRNMTFAVDGDTEIQAKGASRATKKAGGSFPITEFVHSGDVVRVAYRELSGELRVSEIQIRGRNTIASR
jgi:hypothetical protein